MGTLTAVFRSKAVAARKLRPRLFTIGTDGMVFSATLASVLAAASANPIFQSGAIIGGTFILEDAATVLTGLAASDGLVPAPLGLVALYAGIALGDIGLYGLGRLAARHRWAGQYVDHENLAPIKGLLHGRLEIAVLLTRFLPGMRLPTYAACGYFGLSSARFTLAVIVATLIWTTLLFWLALTFGQVAADTLGLWKWPAGLLTLFVVMAIGGRLAKGRAAGKGRR